MIYLDSAATALQKPKEVYRAVENAAFSGNPGRGGHTMALKGARLLYGARERLALHFAAGSPERVVFFYNATMALNTVLKTLLKPGDLVITSDIEHNAVRRPLAALKKRGVEKAVFHGYAKKEAILADFDHLIEKNTKLAVFLHTSNVARISLPVKELCAICRRKGILSLVDCAQAGGHLPISMKELGCDGIVLPSHKGLMGFAGCGILIMNERLAKALAEEETLVEGGSGVHSFEEHMPEYFPERFEAGTVALPAIASVVGGLDYIERVGYDHIADRLQNLYTRTEERMRAVKGVRLYGNDHPGIGPLLFVPEKGDPAAFAERLYERYICVREGYHCAPDAHLAIGSGKMGGIRVSFSVFNSFTEADQFVKAVEEVASFSSYK